jgi:2-hydroxychromene-2-carboxylate isomerase
VPLSFDLYWSFRSPYSYMVTPRLAALVEQYDVVCNVRPVYPLAVRTPEFFDERDPLWVPYLMLDVYREAAYLGLPFRWPRPDPVQRDAQGRYPKEQPYIYRLTHLGVVATERGRGLAFLKEISAVIWSGEISGWQEGDHLAGAAAVSGLDLAELDAVATAQQDRIAAVVEANQVAQRSAGHWGVPLMVFNDEPFFGQDRFDQMMWRMSQAGLKKRVGR